MLKQKRIKAEALSKAGLDLNNPGGVVEQIVMLSARIDNLAEHLKGNKKDLHSTRGLLQMIANRRKLIKYLKRRDLAK